MIEPFASRASRLFGEPSDPAIVQPALTSCCSVDPIESTKAVATNESATDNAASVPLKIERPGNTVTVSPLTSISNSSRMSDCSSAPYCSTAACRSEVLTTTDMPCTLTGGFPWHQRTLEVSHWSTRQGQRRSARRDYGSFRCRWTQCSGTEP